MDITDNIKGTTYYFVETTYKNGKGIPKGKIEKLSADIYDSILTVMYYKIFKNSGFFALGKTEYAYSETLNLKKIYGKVKFLKEMQELYLEYIDGYVKDEAVKEQLRKCKPMFEVSINVSEFHMLPKEIQHIINTQQEYNTKGDNIIQKILREMRI